MCFYFEDSFNLIVNLLILYIYSEIFEMKIPYIFTCVVFIYVDNFICVIWNVVFPFYFLKLFPIEYTEFYFVFSSGICILPIVQRFNETPFN